MTYNTEVVIIKYQQFREYDRIYTVYTKDFGKLAVIARGSNKIKSKLAGHLEPCCLSNLMIAEGKQMEVLAQARTINSFNSIRRNSECYKVAAVFLESLDKLTHTHQKDQEVFDLLIKALERLSETQDVIKLDNLKYHFLLHLLIHLGHAPDMRHEEILNSLLIADISRNDIIVSKEARQLIEQYLRQALDEKRLNSFNF